MPLAKLLLHGGLEIDELLRHGGIQRGHRPGAVGAGADGAELEAVAREGKRRGAVAVGVVDEDLRYLHQSHRVGMLAGDDDVGVVGHGEQLAQHVGHRLAQEGRDNGRRRLVGPQTVGVGGAGY